MNVLLAAFAYAVLSSSAAGYQVENVALGGRATMSSSHSSASVGYIGHATNAIDGNQNSNFHKGSCTHTEREMSPWWRVDLRTPHKIQYVTITNTVSEPQRMNGAELLIGNSLANNGNNNPRCATISSIASGATETFQCNWMVGRYVNLIIRGREEWLTPCEVEVYGIPEEPISSCTCCRETIRT
ncbi:fucolectin-4-like [Ambystoma mexicanum]|uniref:fucolectin-4-like n=1 Tax=Ambystoma mexicanum TaxID=8296 RepID=UPI0037E82794